MRRLAYKCWRRNQVLLTMIVLVRMLTGMHLVTSGLRKMIGERITEGGQEASLMFFVEGLFKLNFYWNWVGMIELIAAFLLMTQRLATLGALVTLFIAGNVGILGLSIGWSGTTPQVFVFLTALLLIGWDYHRFSPLLHFREEPGNERKDPFPEPVNAWHNAGVAIFIVSAGCFILGELYPGNSQTFYHGTVGVFFAACMWALFISIKEQRKPAAKASRNKHDC